MCVLVGIGLIAFWPGEREPEYQGKKLSEWLIDYWPAYASPRLESPDTDKAIRQIGTNALPFLVKWVQMNPDLPAWRVKLFNFVYLRTFNSHAKHKVLVEMIAGRAVRPHRVVSAFKALGAQARGAIPDLVRIAKNEHTGALAAVRALGYIGPEALPDLLRFARDGAFKYRAEAIGAIGQYLGTNAHATVLCLTNCLKDPNVSVATEAADVLGDLGIESEISIPALTECLRSRDETLRSRGVTGLGKFSESARRAVPDLLTCLEDKNDYVRFCATNALRKIAPEVLTNGVRNF